MKPAGFDMDVAKWTATYASAWETGNDVLAASLFTEDASYRASPFREPFRGHQEIREYWRRATGTQDEVHVRMGRPVAGEDLVAVEWWTTMIDEGDEVTLPGCLLLRFEADGRCSDLREYWHLESGRRDPFPGWGE